MESSHDLGSFLSDVRWMELNGVSIHFNILIFFFFFCLRLGSFRADYKYLSIVFLSWISSFPDLQGPSTCFGKRWKNNISAHFYAEHRNVREFFPKKKTTRGNTPPEDVSGHGEHLLLLLFVLHHGTFICQTTKSGFKPFACTVNIYKSPT